MKILLIEDDNDIIEAITVAFNMSWSDVRLLCTHLGRKGIEMVESEEPGMVILDIGLPDISGFEVLKQIRRFSSVPVIILTVTGDEASIAKGLQLGADDYSVKPCGQLELIARIKARLREERGRQNESPISFGHLNFDPVSRELRNRNKMTRLTATESRIIHCLMINEGRITTYSRLADAIWGDDYPGSIDTIRVHIRHLRKKLEDDPGDPDIIMTKTGIGYSLAGPVLTA